MKNINMIQDMQTDLTVISVRGEVKATALMAWIADYYSGTVTCLHLWDFTEADLSKISNDECRNITLEIKTRSNSRMGCKSALVFSNDLMFGLGRMFESYCDIDSVPIYFRCFRDMSKAKNWLEV